MAKLKVCKPYDAISVQILHFYRLSLSVLAGGPF